MIYDVKQTELRHASKSDLPNDYLFLHKGADDAEKKQGRQHPCVCDLCFSIAFTSSCLFASILVGSSSGISAMGGIVARCGVSTCVDVFVDEASGATASTLALCIISFAIRHSPM